MRETGSREQMVGGTDGGEQVELIWLIRKERKWTQTKDTKETFNSNNQKNVAKKNYQKDE